MPNTVAAIEGSVVPKGYQQITSLSASTPLIVPDGSVFAMITPSTQAIRYRDDGTAPTATIGYPIAVGQTLKYTGGLTAIRLIQQTASASVDIAYYGNP